jgi:hypothetical protein
MSGGCKTIQQGLKARSSMTPQHPDAGVFCDPHAWRSPMLEYQRRPIEVMP